MDSQASALNCAIFLDRDDTVIVDKGYLSNPNDIEFLPGVIDNLRRLSDAGYLLVMASNQSGIGRGYFSEREYNAVEKCLDELLRKNGVVFAGHYYCPHAPGDNCECRKPKLYMARKAATDLNIDLHSCYMVGDKESDIEFGKNLGAKGCFYSIFQLIEYMKI